MVGLTRFELVTSRLSVVRSDQLSYRPALKALGYITTTRNNFATTFFEKIFRSVLNALSIQHTTKKARPNGRAFQIQVVGLTRFELVTSRLSVVRSDQLSYRPIAFEKAALASGFAFEWWSERDLNPRHGDFQSPALPTELPDQVRQTQVYILQTGTPYCKNFFGQFSNSRSHLGKLSLSSRNQRRIAGRAPLWAARCGLGRADCSRR